MTNEEFVARVRGMHKLLSGDTMINDRVIIREGRGKAISLIKREANLRRLWQTDTLFTTIPCLEMVEVPIGECCSYTSKVTVSRSKHKLPRISEGLFHYLTQGVYDIGLTKPLVYVDINRYINILKLRLPDNNSYYWIHNSYLYCSSPHVESLKVVSYFEEDIPDEIMFPDCDCYDKKEKDACPDPIKEEFKCPNYLIDGSSGANGVIALVSESLLRTYFNIPLDKTSNNLDEQSK